MVLRRLILTSAFILTALFANAQKDTFMIDYLLQRIATEQTMSDPFFLKAIFPSYISPNQVFSSKRRDNNIFFNGLINYTLTDIYPKLNSRQQILIDSINCSSKPLYSLFKNKKGRETYNFWRTDSTYAFPYTWWIPKIRRSVTLPDDLDDTVMSLMALNISDSVAAQVHALMQNYVNSNHRQIKTTGKPYKKIPAYSVWFGKKFPVVFDICVLSNILTFVQHYNLTWTKADSASLDLIVTTLRQNDHINNSLAVAPYYGKPSITLYHLARLMDVKKIDQLEAIKPQLINDAQNEFRNSKDTLEKVILASALLKWEAVAPDLIFADTTQLSRISSASTLAFFVGNIPSYMPNSYKKPLLAIKWGLFYHYCPAYNNTLLLEYLVLRNTKKHPGGNKGSFENLREDAGY